MLRKPHCLTGSEGARGLRCTALVRVKHSCFLAQYVDVSFLTRERWQACVRSLVQDWSDWYWTALPAKQIMRRKKQLTPGSRDCLGLNITGYIQIYTLINTAWCNLVLTILHAVCRWYDIQVTYACPLWPRFQAIFAPSLLINNQFSKPHTTSSSSSSV